jgi:hypothetical protein
MAGLAARLHSRGLQTREADGSSNNCFLDAVQQQLVGLVETRGLGSWRASTVQRMRNATQHEALLGDPGQMTCTAGGASLMLLVRPVAAGLVASDRQPTAGYTADLWPALARVWATQQPS